jgi:integrase
MRESDSENQDPPTLYNFEGTPHAQLPSRGLENFTFHDLRHTFATRLAEAGVDPFTISDLLGHTTVRMSSDYTHSTPESRLLAIAGLGGYRRPVAAERGKIVAIR